MDINNFKKKLILLIYITVAYLLTIGYCARPWDCLQGSYYNESKQECEDCGLGSYQPSPGESTCIQCVSPKTTVITNATSEADCILSCPEGEFYSTNSATCQKCPQGYYNSETGQTQCESCPYLTYTPGTGATTQEQCTEKSIGCSFLGCCEKNCPSKNADGSHCFCSYDCVSFGDCCQNFAAHCLNCDPGDYFNNNIKHCSPCPLNSYINNSSLQCETCPNGLRTSRIGSTSVLDCKSWCEAGYYLKYEKSGSATCEMCPLDTYKVDTDYFAETCLPCPSSSRNYKNGSTTIKDCKFADCSAGQQFSSQDPMKCEDCALDTYQDNNYPIPYEDVCQKCPQDSGTNETGSTLKDCIWSCSSGQEYSPSYGKCVACKVGTYKDNTLDFNERFLACTSCPNGFTTANNGSVSVTECNIEITGCPAGQELNVTFTSCEPCEIGYYKNTTDFEPCRACVSSFLTADTGSTSSDQCSVRICQKGKYFDSSLNSCELCPKNTYQDAEGKVTCKSCPTNHGTIATGKDDISQCLRFCLSGRELREDKCRHCEEGYYKDNTETDISKFEECQSCPDPKYTTLGLSRHVKDCNVLKCQSGSYGKGGACVKCPLSSYQKLPNQDSCNQCPPGNGTLTTGATSVSDCIDLNNYRFILTFSTTIDCNSFAVNDPKDIQFNKYKNTTILIINNLIESRLGEIYRQFSRTNFIGYRCNSPLYIVVELVLGTPESINKTSDELNIVLNTETKDFRLNNPNGNESIPVNPTKDSNVTIFLPTELKCSSGFYTNLDDHICVPCPKNSYQPLHVNELCWPCPNNTTTDNVATVGEEYVVCSALNNTVTSKDLGLGLTEDISHLLVGLGAGLGITFFLIILSTIVAFIVSKRRKRYVSTNITHDNNHTRRLTRKSNLSKFRGRGYNPYIF